MPTIVVVATTSKISVIVAAKLLVTLVIRGALERKAVPVHDQNRAVEAAAKVVAEAALEVAVAVEAAVAAVVVVEVARIKHIDCNFSLTFLFSFLGFLHEEKRKKRKRKKQKSKKAKKKQKANTTQQRET